MSTVFQGPAMCVCTIASPPVCAQMHRPRARQLPRRTFREDRGPVVAKCVWLQGWRGAAATAGSSEVR
eukprot:12287795-Alexandrium_andersonii.AAC.1